MLVGDVDVVGNYSLNGQLSYLPDSLNDSLQNLGVADFILWAFDLNVKRTDELKGTYVNLLRSNEKSCHRFRGYLGKMKSGGCK